MDNGLYAPTPNLPGLTPKRGVSALSGLSDRL